MGNFSLSTCKEGCSLDSIAQPQLEIQNNQIFQQLTKGIIYSVSPIQTRRSIQNSLIEQGYYIDLLSSKAIIYTKKDGYYEGEIQIINQKPRPNGKGKMIMPNLSQYDGQFKQGKFCGQGKLMNKNKNCYFTGQFLDGFPKQGQLINQNSFGIKQKTKLKNIKILGQRRISAKVEMPKSMKYDGQLMISQRKNLIFDGRGKMVFPDESQYQGAWVSGVMHGEGKYIWPNGDYYEGGYYNGKKNGMGKFFNKSQNYVYQGVWQNGSPIQSFIQQFSREQ